MTTSTRSITFRQYVRLPLLGAAFVEREADRPKSLPFFDSFAERNDGGEVVSMTMRAGRWVSIADRQVPVAWPIGDINSRTQRLATAAWIALGAPLVTLAAVAACLLASPVRHALATLQVRPERS